MIIEEMETHINLNNGESIFIFIDRNNKINIENDYGMFNSIKQTFEFSNKKLNINKKLNKEIIKEIIIEDFDNLIQIQNTFNINDFPSMLIIENYNILDFIPFLIIIEET